MAAEQARRWPPDVIRRCWEKFGSPGEEDDEIEDDLPLQIWGTLETGESLWWQPIRDNPAKWLVVVIGNGWQQLNISTTEFLRRWSGGLLDLPTMSQGAVKREWTFTPPGQPVTVPDLPDVPRDPLAQLKTIIGPGAPVPETFDWAGIEADLGTRLPPDYKLLRETFREVLPSNVVVPPGDLKSVHEMFRDQFCDEAGPAFRSRRAPAVPLVRGPRPHRLGHQRP